MTHTLPQLHERWRVTKKLLTSRREGCSAFVSHEQRPPKLLLEGADPCADRRLTDIEPLSGPNEVPGRNDLEEGSGEFGIHILSSTKYALKRQLNSIVPCVC